MFARLDKNIKMQAFLRRSRITILGQKFRSARPYLVGQLFSTVLYILHTLWANDPATYFAAYIDSRK